MFGYIFLLGKIGFYFDTLILSMAIMWLLGYRRKIVLIMASLLITTVVFVIFYVLIKVPLPTLFF
ncbi:tripartite tricarboxylate transporter TctB family protein [Enterocloster asparagiformis]|uniref:tripartite tricarboxylate transporter TctB family protein n=1 Tax=Enterocloster asparagiformis TaxID=333367 RepID=UPI0002FBEFD0|nr:tripartite tricarboxylate transporter TctB family protein [Enterocloster asparagiformis]